MLQKNDVLRLHFARRGVELSGLKEWTIPRISFLMEIQTMKRLLVITAVVMLSTSAIGCGCRPWGYWLRRAACCNAYGPAGPTVTYADPYLADPYLAPPTIEIVPGPVTN